ncbi:MAG: relaxase/mobilization nuclease domain-containing protein [Lachnospiraceae bacterium]|nr:relaxase/mobilization nuclease domain-containing protein [Lachnospiraceae bacterium]
MGIIAKIWNIKAGSQGRSGGAQISSSIDYITNSEKCDGQLPLVGALQVGREVTYVTNDIKTLEGLYVGARNISDISNAVDEMMQVKRFYQKLDGRVALHGIISLDEDESAKENAGKLMFLCDELMEKIFPDNQIVYAVHTNTDNLHIHFIANTVGLDGKKIHMDKNFMREVFEPAVNELALKYGFSPNEVWMRTKRPDEVSFKDRKIMLRKAIDLAVEEADDFDEFLKELRDGGIVANVGKHLSLRMEGMVKAVRSGQLGEGYSIDAIKERIATKREPFIKLSIEHHVKSIEAREVVTYVPTTLKKYKDMSPDEKKKTIHLLRMGRNPWQERYETNWQIKRMSESLSKQAHVFDIIRHFSPKRNNVTEAKEAIVAVQKEIAAEKKAIKQNLRKYKPISDLYEEIKQHEVRAYLYEFADCKEYETDYEAYKEGCHRLEEHYGKTIGEVAAFIEDQNNQLLYAKAQSNELSEQYRAIVAYEKADRRKEENTSLNFFEAVGHSLAFRQAKDYGIYATRLVMITADDVEDYKIRVMTTPDTVGGKATVVTTVTVLDREEKVVDEFSSRDVSSKEFNSLVNEVKYTYGFEKCHVTAIKDNSVVSQRGRASKR